MSTELFDRLLAIGNLLHRDMARAFDGTALTESRVAVLWTLQAAGPSTQREVATALGVSGKNVSMLVDALEHSGYVRRGEHPTDRRAVLVELTGSAEKTMATMRREHGQLASTLAAAIDPVDLPAVERGLEAVVGRLQQLVDDAAAGREGGAS